MGRRSYDQMLGFGPWPYAGKRTVVMTRRSLTPTTPDTEISVATVETVADRLAAETRAGDVWVFGGGEIARAFLNARRVDTLELCVVPLVIGAGIPLFGPGTPPLALRLITARSYPKDLVRLDYEII
jgi:dihydrofolate reductase